MTNFIIAWECKFDLPQKFNVFIILILLKVNLIIAINADQNW